MGEASERMISPPVGEMSGRTEGGATERGVSGLLPHGGGKVGGEGAHPTAPPSALPGISPTSGEITLSAATATLRDLVAYWLDADPAAITPQTRMVEDLACDSLTRTALAIEIENEFRVELTDDEIAAADTFGALVALVDTRVERKPS